ncbi:MAG: hypothetical protein JNJ77_20895 [Planctomycetia bacterium]|nr:hypothetical protein [Planctomycetia bacterium]
MNLNQKIFWFLYGSFYGLILGFIALVFWLFATGNYMMSVEVYESKKAYLRAVSWSIIIGTMCITGLTTVFFANNHRK